MLPYRGGGGWGCPQAGCAGLRRRRGWGFAESNCVRPHPPPRQGPAGIPRTTNAGLPLQPRPRPPTSRPDRAARAPSSIPGRFGRGHQPYGLPARGTGLALNWLKLRPLRPLGPPGPSRGGTTYLCTWKNKLSSSLFFPAWHRVQAVTARRLGRRYRAHGASKCGACRGLGSRAGWACAGASRVPAGASALAAPSSSMGNGSGALRGPEAAEPVVRPRGSDNRSRLLGVLGRLLCAGAKGQKGSFAWRITKPRKETGYTQKVNVLANKRCVLSLVAPTSSMGCGSEALRGPEAAEAVVGPSGSDNPSRLLGALGRPLLAGAQGQWGSFARGEGDGKGNWFVVFPCGG